MKALRAIPGAPHPRLPKASHVMAVVALSAWALSSCARPVPESPVASPAPTTVAATSRGPTVTASVKVVPAEYAEMSFLVSAPVREIPVTEGETVKAGQTLISLDVPDLEYGVKAAEAALKSALTDEYIQSQGRRKWDGFKFVWMSGPPEQRQVAHARVVQAEAGLDAAQAELGQATLVAPFDGTVVAIRIDPGEVAQPGQVALVIGNLDHLQIETTDLSERDVSRVHVGDMAHVRLKAFPGPLPGKVTAIEPKGGMSADGDVIYRVTIELDQGPAQILWGMTGEVEIDASG